VFPFCWEILDGEDSIEERDEEGDRPQWKMIQGPVRYTVRTRRLAMFAAPDGFSNLHRVG
jgi:hypothetical protein